MVNKAESTLLITSAVGLLFSLLTLLLICRSKKANNFTLLIFSLATCQGINEISLIMTAAPDPVLYITFHGLRVFGALSSAFLTNVIAYSVKHIILNKRSFNIVENLKLIFFVVIVPPAILSILAIISLSQDYPNLFYYTYGYIFMALHIASIVFNIIVCAILIKHNYLLNGSILSPKMNDPMSVLSYRMILYPIAQIISFIGYMAIFAAIKFPGTDLNFSGLEFEPDNVQAAAFIGALSLPSGGIAYFIIYVMLNRSAKQYLSSFLKYRPSTPITEVLGTGHILRNPFMETSAIESTNVHTISTDSESSFGVQFGVTTPMHNQEQRLNSIEEMDEEEAAAQIEIDYIANLKQAPAHVEMHSCRDDV